MPSVGAGALSPAWRLPSSVSLRRGACSKALKAQSAAAPQPSGGLDSSTVEAYVVAGTISQTEAKQYTREQLEFLVRKRRGLTSPLPEPRQRGGSPAPRRTLSAEAAAAAAAAGGASAQSNWVAQPGNGAESAAAVEPGSNTGSSSNSSGSRRARWAAEGLADDGAAPSTNGFGPGVLQSQQGLLKNSQGQSLCGGQANGQLTPAAASPSLGDAEQQKGQQQVQPQEQPGPQEVEVVMSQAAGSKAGLAAREEQQQRVPSQNSVRPSAVAAHKAGPPREIQAIQLLLEMEEAEVAKRRAAPSPGLVTTQAAVSMTVVGFLTGIFLLLESGVVERVPAYLEPLVPESVRQAAEVAAARRDALVVAAQGAVQEGVRQVAEVAGTQQEALALAAQVAVQEGVRQAAEVAGAQQEALLGAIQEAAQLKGPEVGLGLGVGPPQSGIQLEEAGYVDMFYSYAAAAGGAALGFVTLIPFLRDGKGNDDDAQLPEPDPMTYWVGATVGATAGFTTGFLASLLLLPK